nr:hypothetical protein [Chroogloeocystis siderophila]
MMQPLTVVKTSSCVGAIAASVSLKVWLMGSTLIEPVLVDFLILV